MSEEYCPDCESPMIKTKTEYCQKIGDKDLYIPEVEAFVCTNEQCGNKYITNEGSIVIDNAYKKFFIKPKQILKIKRKITVIGKDKLGIYLPSDIIRAYNSINGKRLNKKTYVDIWIDEDRIIMEPV